MGFYESHKGMFTSDKLDWETPQWLFDKLDAKYHFDVDVFTNGRNSKCGRFFTPEDDAMSKSWGGLTWFANPPYGRGMGEFIRKCAEESSRSKGVLLVPARTDTGWFWKHVAPYARVEFIRGRLRFEVGGVPGQSAPFPSMLAFYGEEPNIAQFR